MMYVLSYFRTEAEALHLAVSRDGLRWQALNGNLPLMDGEHGTGLRDPFVMQAQDGLFHLFATDGWTSNHIIHATSPDLLAWSAQERLPVMRHVPQTRNCWAPECFFDREAGVYRVLWSTSTTEPNHAHDLNHRIWSTSTRDFVQYTPAQVFFDDGYSVIDATVVFDDGWYWMAFKDERGTHAPDTGGKAIRLCRSRHGSGPFAEVSEPVTPPLTEGPALFRAGGRWVMLYDHFAEAKFGARVSADGWAWTDVSERLVLPDGVRHAAVLEVSDALGNVLTAQTTASPLAPPPGG